VPTFGGSKSAVKAGGIILAGGKGRRFGGDKAAVLLLGESLLQRAVSNLEFLKAEIVVVLAPGQSLPVLTAGVKLKAIHDAVADMGPLAGISAGLANSQYQYNVVIACDMPLVNVELLQHMISIADGFDAVVPRLGRHIESLQAVYSKDCAPEIDKLLARGILKASNLTEHVKTRFIDSAEIDRYDPQHLSFMNINTPTDLEKARDLLGRGQV
jgi:molybdenum cofactor guanylyltransferase